MKSIRNLLAAGVLALALPLAAGQASAAEAKLDTPVQSTLTGGTVLAQTGLVGKRATEKSGYIVEARRRRGRAIRGLAAGIIAGAAAAAIISGSSRANAGHRPYRSHRNNHYDRCERWYYRCEDGIRRACRKYYRYCD